MSDSSSFWRDRPTFVTGGMGLVGSWLTKDLVERGASVFCLERDEVPDSHLWRAGLRDRVTVISGAVENQELMERVMGEFEIDTVFHLAAQTLVPVANRNPVSTFRSNIEGTWSLLEAARRSPLVKQIVVASSDKAYGDQPVLPYNENMPLAGKHPYDVSKSCADLIAQSYAATFDLPVVISRCGNFYGGGDLNWNRIVPGTIRSVTRGERPVIRSDGTLIRDYFYVEDGSSAYMLLAEQLAANSQLRGQAFNFSTELQMTVLEIVQKILSAMQSDLKPEVLSEATHEIKHQWLSAKKARDVLGWQPRFSFDEGLQKTTDWYSAFLRT